VVHQVSPTGSIRCTNGVNKAGFRKDVVIGRGKGISSRYPNGDKGNRCPGGKAQSAALELIRDPKAKGNDAKVTEPPTCDYKIACGDLAHPNQA